MKKSRDYKRRRERNPFHINTLDLKLQGIIRFWYLFEVTPIHKHSTWPDAAKEEKALVKEEPNVIAKSCEITFKVFSHRIWIYF